MKKDPSQPGAENPLSLSAVRRPPFTKLRWRCRRGMKELDVVLERYLEQRYACAPIAEQQAFEALLDLPDPQLFAYVMRREEPTDSGWVDVINKLAPIDR
ncbi:MAG: succinate dehydrogenase assembly factor 2 [Xanthomonadaceae bacterium]|nr:succinate dehydrogenase assembly factor 2 [Xanthomonadaceae bacterium]